MFLPRDAASIGGALSSLLRPSRRIQGFRVHSRYLTNVCFVIESLGALPWKWHFLLWRMSPKCKARSTEHYVHLQTELLCVLYKGVTVDVPATSMGQRKAQISWTR